MRRLFATALLALTLGLPAAQALEWESAIGVTFDVYLEQAVENPDDRFAIMGLIYDTEGKTLNEVVALADTLFEERLIHFAAGNGLSAAVVRFSPPGDVAVGVLPAVTADVRYETYDGQHWGRINFLEVPVGPSPLFPSSPIVPVVLSSDEELELEPATILFADDRDRRELNVRAVYPFFFIDEENGNRVLALLWDEVIRSMAREEGVNRVSIAIYSEVPTSRFDYRPAYAGVFTKERWENWPTYARMSEGAE